jgi:hypothetical protein
MHPKVMVLNFHNPSTEAATRVRAQALIDALSEGSRYHAYRGRPSSRFLRYEIDNLGVVDLTDHPIPAGWPYKSSTLYPVSAKGDFDVAPLFSQAFATAHYPYPDPLDPGRKLTLCELFERGRIHELWLQAGEDLARAMPNILEYRQAYDSAGVARPGQFTKVVLACPTGDCLPLPACQVTVRIAHLSPERGVGCDLNVRAYGIEELSRTIPDLAADLPAFLNRDFQTRFGASFASWDELCDGVQPCVSYPTPTTAMGVDLAGRVFSFDPFTQGCGTRLFPPNATFRYDYANASPVDSRCGHFQLKDDPETGGDLSEPYSDASVAAYTAIYGRDCGGGWQMYWRQSLPGYGNKAWSGAGKRMRNWWPYLFY